MKTTKYIIFTLFLALLASCEPTTVLDIENEAGANLGVYSYPMTQVNFRVGDPVEPIAAKLTDSGVFGFSVEPELPAGMNVNPDTGEISGVALEVTPRRTYTFKANLNKIGVEYRYDIAIEITHIPPSNLNYLPNELNLTYQNSFTPVSPTYNGVPDSFSISPELPAGLVFNESSGAIAGSPFPLIENYEATHFIRARNPGGESVTALTIRIVPQPPVSISYGSTAYICFAGNSCNGITVSSLLPVTANNLNFTISPELPEGYQFNTTTGEISLAFGARLEPSPQTNYTVSVFNDGGSASTIIELATIVQPITVLNYPSTSILLDKDIHTPISITPTHSPFYTPIDQYIITTANLPDSLTFNNLTGEISGVTSEQAGNYNVTIRAINGVSFQEQTINFTINEAPITGLALVSAPNVYILGQTISINIDSSTGQPVPIYTYNGSHATSYTFEHLDENLSSLGTQLPSGLSWNTATGNVIGTPAQLITGHTLRVWANNGQGASAAPVDIPFNISEPAPIGLSYSGIPSNVSACSDFNISPSLSGGGAPLSFSINPPLGTPTHFPEITGVSEGLNFDPQTGIISGNISEHYPTVKIYNITAENPAGSTSTLISISTTPDAPNFTIADFSASRGQISSVIPMLSSCSQDFTAQITPNLPTEFSLASNNQLEYSGTIVGPNEYPSLVAKKPYNYTLSNSTSSLSKEVDIELRYRLAGTNNISVPIIVDFDNDNNNDINMIQSFCEINSPFDCHNPRFSHLRSMNSNGEYSETFSQILPTDKVTYPAIFDVNQDGLKDLIYQAANNGPAVTNQIFIQLQQNTIPVSLGPVYQTLNIPLSSRSIQYADMNSDSIPDIFVANNASILIYYSNSTTNLYETTPIIISPDNFTSGIDKFVLTHLNVDNMIDIILLKQDNSTLCPLISSSPTTGNYPQTCSSFLGLPLTGAQEIYAGNLDGDTKYDLVVVTRDTTQTPVKTQLITIKNNGNSFASYSPLAQQISPRAIEPGKLIFSNIMGTSQKDIIYWGDHYLTVLDGSALNNNTTSPQEIELQGLKNLTGGLLYGGQDALVTCLEVSGDGSCAIDFSAQNLFN